MKNDGKCGEPASKYFYNPEDDSGPKPLCEEHATEYRQFGLRVDRLDDDNRPNKRHKET